MSELGDDFKAIRQERRTRLEPRRWEAAVKALVEELGDGGAVAEISGANGRHLLVVVGEHERHYWPYTGWWQGEGRSGRGLVPFLDEIKRIKEENHGSE